MATASPSGVSLAVAEVLRIAHQDAHGLYGWHVDYDMAEPLSAGGGPHYGVHPETGGILVRRYEQ